MVSRCSISVLTVIESIRTFAMKIAAKNNSARICKISSLCASPISAADDNNSRRDEVFVVPSVLILAHEGIQLVIWGLNRGA